MEHCQLHKLSFYPRNVDLTTFGGVDYPASDDQHDAALRWNLDQITTQLFGVPLSAFAVASKTTTSKRKAWSGYSYNEQILLLVRFYKGEARLSIEVNGDAFDSIDLDWSRLFDQVATDYIVTEMHARIDTTATSFDRLWSCHKQDSVTANSTKRTDYSSSSRTLYFGSGDRLYSIYEAGILHGLPDPTTVRHELQIKGQPARDLFAEFMVAPANLGTIIKSHIAGTFGVQFRKVTKDTNVARRPVLPCWSTFLADTRPSYLQTPVKPSNTDTDAQRVVVYLLRYRHKVDDATYRLTLALADAAVREQFAPLDTSPPIVF